jgi:hypothetical protein
MHCQYTSRHGPGTAGGTSRVTWYGTVYEYHDAMQPQVVSTCGACCVPACDGLATRRAQCVRRSAGRFLQEIESTKRQRRVNGASP